jgi:hypothetical protein
MQDQVENSDKRTSFKASKWPRWWENQFSGIFHETTTGRSRGFCSQDKSEGHLDTTANQASTLWKGQSSDFENHTKEFYYQKNMVNKFHIPI